MCGLVGAFCPVGGEVPTREVLRAMTDRMVHRGPDGYGVWRSADGKVGLGHRRLSIIDLSEAAAQPMFNHDGSVVLVFNGEIYNHAAIRAELDKTGRYRWRTDHSDTETLLHAYEEWGLECVHRFYGMFAFAIYDTRVPDRPVLHLVRDRIGIKPLYFAKTDAGEWVFGSEIRALLAHPGLSAAMDPVAFYHYLTFIVAPAPLTLFRGIFKLPAGHVMTIDATGYAAARQYWDVRPDQFKLFTPEELSEEEAVTELIRRLKISIERRMVSDVPFGVLLSGGVDSSMNVALMSELMDRPVTSFTIGYEGQEESNEFQFARRIAARYRTDHHETLINAKDAQDFLPLLVQLQDEPIADNVCIPLYFLAKLVRESGTTVVQVGEGADENWLGYWWCEHYREKEEKIYRPAQVGNSSWWRRALMRAGDATPGLSGEDLEIHQRGQNGQELFWGGAVCWTGKLRRQLTPNLAPFASAIHCPVDGLLPDGHRSLDSHNVVAHYTAGLTGKLGQSEVLRKLPYMELKLRLPEHLLMRVDKMTMAHAIEARVPFLDHELVEFAARVPPSYKLREGVGKRILKRAAEPYIDHDLIYRKKQGFGAPMESWFKEEGFGKRCWSAWEGSTIRKQGFFDNDYFDRLLKHQMGEGGGYSFHIWTVLNAVLWYNSWIDGKNEF